MTVKPLKRMEVLDSIRGIAAFSVVLHHCFLVLPVFYLSTNYMDNNNQFASNVIHSPLHIFFAGNEAVMLFFILSGFVLALPFLHKQPFSYLPYLLKRFIRIYIQYIISIILSLLLYNSIERSGNHLYSNWFNEMWIDTLTVRHLFSYVFMTGYDTHSLNTVTWSLIYEMRVSLFFPLLMFFVVKINWKKILIGSFSVLWGGWVICNVMVKISNVEFFYSLGSTLYFTPFFLLGALLAKHREFLCLQLQRISTGSRYFVCHSNITLYSGMDCSVIGALTI